MEIAIILLLVVAIGLLFILLSRSGRKKDDDLLNSVRQLINEGFAGNRVELNTLLKENREEMSAGLLRLTSKLEEKLGHITEGIHKNSRDDREELSRTLKSFQESFSTNVKEFNDLQKQKFDDMARRQDELVKSTELKLEKMRETVDEKLHKTLEERLGQSFKLVSERLESVQKGLGEMQALASGVGDLKKVLTNVKTRGVMGEIQLGNILEQILSPEQYEANVKLKAGSADHVEFAIKLPGKDDSGQAVYLPIDAKFPQEDYLRLQTAFEIGDREQIEAESKKLVQAIKKNARDIRDKYINPPRTTDFGIMFLPFEGLYAEVARQPELLTTLQGEFKIIVTGPTTLAAMLNSLQMGFKTLAIQKRSSEVWQVLGAVKTEFGKFGEVLEKARKKINEADKELDTLVGARTRVLMSKLKTVEQLPAHDNLELQPGATDFDNQDVVED